MLRVRPHGPVTELRLTTTILGRPVYSVSAFYFDGTLIDTGPPRTGPELAAWVEGQNVEQIVNTHRHEDHVGGNAHLAHLPALAPAGAAPVIREAPPLPFYRRVVFGQPRPAPVGVLGETVPTAHCTLRVIPTPGHAPDHVVLWLPERGWLFSADLYLMERAKYVRRLDNVGQWVESLQRVLTYDFDTMFCSHAGRIADAKAAIRRKLAYWAEVQEQARQLATEGFSAREIRDRLLGREGFITLWSRGQFAKLNLIKALLALEKNISDPGLTPAAA